MSNYTAAALAVKKVLGVECEIHYNDMCDADVYIDGKRRGVIKWRSCRSSTTKRAYYELHSFVRETSITKI